MLGSDRSKVLMVKKAQAEGRRHQRDGMQAGLHHLFGSEAVPVEGAHDEEGAVPVGAVGHLPTQRRCGWHGGTNERACRWIRQGLHHLFGCALPECGQREGGRLCVCRMWAAGRREGGCQQGRHKLATSSSVGLFRGHQACVCVSVCASLCGVRAPCGSCRGRHACLSMYACLVCVCVCVHVRGVRRPHAPCGSCRGSRPSTGSGWPRPRRRRPRSAGTKEMACKAERTAVAHLFGIGLDLQFEVEAKEYTWQGPCVMCVVRCALLCVLCRAVLCVLCVVRDVCRCVLCVNTQHPDGAPVCVVREHTTHVACDGAP